jgi:hypothetical protein
MIFSSIYGYFQQIFAKSLRMGKKAQEAASQAVGQPLAIIHSRDAFLRKKRLQPESRRRL